MTDITIIGAGIVGLATAYQLLQKKPGLKLSVIEKEGDVAQHQTGHNSGVIHSGIYYTPGGLKAKNCKKGYDQLIDFCEKEEVPFDICGKVIVATQADELPVLDTILKKGNANGLTGLKIVGPERLKEIEPHVNGIRGIIVPQTGIIDYAVVAKKYKEKILQAGGNIYLDEKVTDIKLSSGGAEIITTKQTHQTKLIINCAGLFADKIARLNEKKMNLKVIPFRGEYYTLKKEKHHLVNNLIYPVPNPKFPFLGVHFTRMIHGGVEAGPNAVLAFKREGYKKTDINLIELAESLTYPGFLWIIKKFWKKGLDEMYRSWSKIAFVHALQKLIPEIQKEDLETGGAGVRAQAIDRKGNLIDDFLILENKNVINVINAPSPAATASLAVGEHIAEIGLRVLG